jgi:hypothetical protein
MNRYGFLSAAAFLAVGILYPPDASPAGEPAAEPISRLTAQADSIVIGRPAEPLYNVDILGAKRGLWGYKIEATKHIKGCGDVVIKWDADWKFELPPQDSEKAEYIYFLRMNRAAYSGSQRGFPVEGANWFVLATAENVAAVESSLSVPAEWGREKDGLRFGIKPQREVFGPNDPVVIELFLQNVSKRNIFVPAQRVRTHDYYPFVSLSGGTGIKRIGKTAYSYGRGVMAFFEKPMGVGHSTALPPIELGPAEVYRDSIRLDSWQWATSDSQKPFRSNTKWLLHAWFDTVAIPEALRCKPDEKARYWRGRLESNYVELVFE